MSFEEQPQPDACRAWLPRPVPAPPGPPSAPMVCHMPTGHEGPHAPTRRPGPIDRRWEGDARPDRPAPSPAAAGLPDEDVERVARALWEAASDHPDRPVWPEVGSALRDYYRRLAAAALAEMRPTAAEEAVERVEALADELEREATVIAMRAGVPPLDFVRLWRDDAPARIRAALAPVPDDADGGERR